jgi:hypothetical protein
MPAEEAKVFRDTEKSTSVVHAVSSNDIDIREFKLRVIRQTANARQRKILRYKGIKSK